MKDKYYFLRMDGTYLEVSKDINSKELEDLRNTYIEKQNSLFFKYLFEQGAFPYHHRQYRFLSLYNDLSQVDLSTVSELVKSLASNVDILFLKGQVVFFYKTELDFSFKDIFNTISDDMSISLKIFESCPLKAEYPQDFLVIFLTYLKYLHHGLRPYSTICDLIFDINKTNFEDLKILKPIILKDIIIDSQLENLVNVFLANNLNISKTAKLVYMHRNTIMNKIDYIEKTTGLNIQDFHNAVAMYLLLTVK